MQKKNSLLVLCLSGVLAAAPAAQSGNAGQKPADTAHQGHSMQLSDGDFANLMIKHHREGIEMAKIEESGGASDAVKALAAKIRQGQEKDIAELNAFAKKHKATDMAATHEKEMQKEHMQTMSKLKNAKAESLDQAFVTEMIRHHQSALEMTKQAQFKDHGLHAFADRMSKNQRAELQELQTLQQR
jgi:uncharacterized protein (DUF305 family)